jgi:hypothetical protein
MVALMFVIMFQSSMGGSTSTFVSIDFETTMFGWHTVARHALAAADADDAFVVFSFKCYRSSFIILYSEL